MKTQIRKTVIAAMLSALACVATIIIKIPSPLNGYINLGDCIVLLSGWLLSPVYGFFAAAVGSGLADVFSGFVTYAPATFVIKGFMALCAHFLYNLLVKRAGDLPSRIISGLCTELVMVGGYYVFEGFLYGLGSSLINVPANAVQGAAGVILGIVLIRMFDRYKILR